MHIDDHLANADKLQPRQRYLQQLAAVDFNQRFRTVVGERTQTRAKPGSENHRLHWSIAFAIIDSVAPAPDVARLLPLPLYFADASLAVPPNILNDAARRCIRTRPSDA